MHFSTGIWKVLPKSSNIRLLGKPRQTYPSQTACRIWLNCSWMGNLQTSITMQFCVTQPKIQFSPTQQHLLSPPAVIISLIRHHFTYLRDKQNCFLEQQNFCSRWHLGGKRERCNQGECWVTTVFIQRKMHLFQEVLSCELIFVTNLFSSTRN